MINDNTHFRSLLPMCNLRVRLLVVCYLIAVCLSGPLRAAEPDWAALEAEASDNPVALLQKLPTVSDLQTQPQALLIKAAALALLEDFPGAEQAATQGLTLAQSQQATALQARLLAIRTFSRSIMGQWDAAKADLDAAAALLKAHPDPRAQADLDFQSGQYNELRNQLPQALDAYTRAYDGYTRLKLPRLQGEVQGAIGTIFARLNDLNKALDAYDRSLKLLSNGNRMNRSILLYNIAGRMRDAGRREEALQRFQQARTLSTELKDSAGEAYIDFEVGRLMKGQQPPQLKEAIAAFQSALPVFVANANPTMVFQINLELAEAFAMQGNRAASAYLQQADSARQKLGSQERSRDYFVRAAAVQAQLGDMATAYASLRQAWDANQTLEESNNRKLTEEMQARFEVETRNKENRALQAERAMQQEHLNALRWRQWLIGAIGFFLLAGIGLYLFIQIRQKQRFAALALRDELTGARNRRAILEYAQRRFDERTHSGNRLCVAMMDLDHFKSVNDTWGHEAGDIVLKTFAKTALEVLRETDWLGRFGGEEWLLVMPGARAEHAERVFAQLRHHLHEKQVLPQAPQYQAKFSMGITEVSGDDKQLSTAIERADAALYEAKHHGRDRCVVARNDFKTSAT